MKIDLSCPAEVRACALPRTDHEACDLTLFNLSDRQIVSVEVSLSLYTADGEEADRLTCRVHDLDGRPDTIFAAAVPCPFRENIARVMAMVEKVWFGDNSVWRRGKDALTEYTPNDLPNSKSLEMLRYVVGPGAVGFPQEQDNVWLCVCGRPNALRASVCVRCHREKNQVFHQYSREAIEKLAAQKEKQLQLKTKASRENSDRIQLQREQEYNRKKARRRKTLGVICGAAAVLVLAYGTIFHLLPYLRYRKGVDLLEEGKPAEAVAIFSEMNDARSEAKLKECHFLLAKEDLASGDEDRLASARDVFLSMPEREEAAALAREAEFKRASLLLEKDEVDAAREIFVALSDAGVAGSAEQITECDYRQAVLLLESGEYDRAGEMFRSLKDYRDATELANETVYRPALELLNDGKWQEAIAKLETIPDHAMAESKITEARYGLAADLAVEGKYETAAENYLLCGEYQNAPALANACLYALAEEKLAAGETENAMELYARLPGYEDADEKFSRCVMTLADAARDEMEYARARDLLARLPRATEESEQLRKACLYLPGVAALKQKNWQNAVELLSQVPGYEDADKQLQKARYGYAAQLAKKENYEEAAAQYELLGDYSDSEKQLQSVRYRQARQLLDRKDAAAAAILFEALDDYKDSATKLKEANYLLAGQLLEDGKPEEARSLYEKLGKYEDAARKLAACDYAIADALEKSGETEQAALLFLSIAKEQDARDRASRLCRELGQKCLELGDKLGAAGWLDRCAGDEEAAARASELYAAYYQDAMVTVQDCMENGDYALAAAMLENMNLKNLPEAYASLPEMYLEANYKAGMQLFDEGRPYAALPYFRAAEGYGNTTAMLGRYCYRIIGTWYTDAGETYEFRDDGTCDLKGTPGYFTVSNYDLQTGETKENLASAWRINNLTDTRLSLKPAQGAILQLTREQAPEQETKPEAPRSDAAEQTTPEKAPEEKTDQGADDVPEEKSRDDYQVKDDEQTTEDQ